MANKNQLISCKAIEFPYRKNYLPSFEVMFKRLLYISQNIPKDWLNPTKQHKFGVGFRTFPEDYNEADSLTDHFIEPIRILCNEQNQISPYEAWVKIQNQTSPSIVKSISDWREDVYNASRGCNLYNTALGIYTLHSLTQQKDVSVLDCTSGWGDRLIAAFAVPNVSIYRGFDTNFALQNGYNNIAENCQKLVKKQLDWKIICEPFESIKNTMLTKNGDFMLFDIVFTSPPFYYQELYKGQKTSTALYKTPKDWENKFYIPMIEISQSLLKPGGYIALYIAPYMFQLTNRALTEMEYQGALGFKQIVSGYKSKIRDTYIWKKKEKL
jgi:16S rRNA G966 N2-methylase RsmD